MPNPRIPHKAINGIEHKLCSECQEWKPLNQYAKDSHRRWDGLRHACKKCGSARYRAWRLSHKKEDAVRTRTYEARKRNAEGSFTAEEFQALCDETGNKCLCCGSLGPLVIDHVIPLSKGGSNNISNIQPLCGPCNSSKRSKTTDYRKEDFI